MNCPYCPMSDPEMKVIFEHDLVLFMQHERYQGALKHSETFFRSDLVLPQVLKFLASASR